MLRKLIEYVIEVFIPILNYYRPRNCNFAFNGTQLPKYREFQNRCDIESLKTLLKK